MRLLLILQYMRIFYFLIFFSALPLMSCPTANAVKSPHSDNGIGILLTNAKGTILYEKNIDRYFIPASTLKILTSLEAFHFLGENFHFHTDFYMDKQNNLKIKGYGDPLLTSEAIKSLCNNLGALIGHKNKKQLSSIIKLNSIIIDDTFFSHDINIPGTGKSCNPYDAPVGAMCANFNTVFFSYDKSTSRFISAEQQTPLLPFVKTRVKASKLKQGRIVLSRRESRFYAPLLIKYFLKLQGIHFINDTSIVAVRKSFGIFSGRVQKDDKKILTWVSPYSLREIIQKLLRYSNNFIANQIFLHIGAKELSPPATVKKGVQVLTDYAENTLEIKKIKIDEGSGLSKNNRITPREMIKLLFNFMPYHDLMKKKSEIIKIKLKRLNTYKVTMEEFYKTGTLNNVRTRAGYFKINSRLYPYVIMVNQKKSDYNRHEADRNCVTMLLNEHRKSINCFVKNELFLIKKIKEKLQKIVVKNSQ